MVANALLSTRINAETKKEAAKIFSEWGLSLSDAVRMMLAKTVREKTCPRSLFWEPNAETAQAMKDMDSGIGVKSCDTIEELMVQLNAKD